MSASNGSARSQVYKRLKKGFWKFSGMLNVHLEDTLLREMGVDAIQINLEEETERGGLYFLPMSQERLDSLDYRSEFRITYDPEFSSSSVWDFYDADIIYRAFLDQYYYNNDESLRRPYETTPWQLHDRHQGTYQSLLRESGSPDHETDPRRRFMWRLSEDFVARGFSHRSCISIAGIPNVKGLVRSEMMIVTGMMISTLRQKQNQDVVIVPLLLVSIIGRYARIIQAHVSLEERRLKIRYSRLYDFDNCSQPLMDLFLRWILSSPLLEPKLQREASEPPGSPSGNTAPRVKVSKLCGESCNNDNLRFAVEDASAVR